MQETRGSDAEKAKTIFDLFFGGMPFASPWNEEEGPKLKQKMELMRNSQLIHSEIKEIAPKLLVIKRHISLGGDVNYQDDDGYTPLMLAVDAQSDRVVEYLLRHGANPMLKNKHGEIASDLASRQSPIYELLKEKERTLQYDSLSPSEKYTRLLYDHIGSSEVCAKKIDEYLKLGANINFQDSDGFTVLMLAVDKGNDRIAEYLLNKGANPALKNKSGETASDFASSQSQIYELLKQREKAYSHGVLSPRGKYSMMLLAYLRGSEVRTQKIDEYLGLGADIDLQDAHDYTLLMLVVDNENERIAEYLLRCGANPLLKNKYGKMASDLASRNAGIYRILKGYELLFSTVFNDVLSVKAVLSSDKSLIDFQGRDGYTGLLIAVENNLVELVELYLSYGADMSILCHNGQGVFDLVTDDEIRELLKIAIDTNELQVDVAPSSCSSSRENSPQVLKMQDDIVTNPKNRGDSELAGNETEGESEWTSESDSDEKNVYK